MAPYYIMALISKAQSRRIAIILHCKSKPFMPISSLPVMRFLCLLICMLTVSLAPLRAHEVQPLVADITVGSDQVTLELKFNSEVFLAGIDASTTADTNDSDKADDYDQLRALDEPALARTLRQNEAALVEAVILRAGSIRLEPSISGISIEPGVPFELPRMTTLIMTADLPDDGTPVVLGLDPALGPFAIRQNAPYPEKDGLESDALYTDYIAAGLNSLPIPRQGGVEREWHSVLGDYIIIGIDHIIPKGLDHIVFIMGLFFFSPRWRPLLMQVTVFTLAHSVTLALATLDLVRVEAMIVEPLIALSIAWIGVENIIRPKIGITRLGVIFIFGLLHGLGFAFVLGEVGLAGSDFVLSLVAFNIGVELGQIMVLIPLLVMGAFIARRGWYRPGVEIPASALIAGTGGYWFVERVITG